jgi:Leucine-rich repeat (LRR) protein
LEIYGVPQSANPIPLSQRIAATGNELVLSGLDVLHLDRLAELRHLKQLRLSQTIVDDEGLEHLKILKGLEELSLEDTWVTDAGLEHLAQLVSLQSLNLSNTRITDAGLRNLKELRHLRKLKVDDTAITGIGLEHLSECHKLEDLSLVFSMADRPWPSIRNVQGVTPEGMKSIGRLHSLRSLMICGSEITDDAVSALRSLSSLEELLIFKAKIKGPGLAHLKEIKTLRKLDLDGDHLTDESVDFLAQLQQLKELSFLEHRISLQGMKRLRASLPTTCELFPSVDEESR